MAVKNFREDIDIKRSGKVATAAPGSAGPVFSRGDIRTMQKDLELVRSHLAAEPGVAPVGPKIKPANFKVLAEEGPKTILSEGLFKKAPLMAAEPVAKLASKAVVAKAVTRPVPAKPVKADKRSRPVPSMAELAPMPMRAHITFFHVLLESLLSLAFLILLLASVGYYWFVIRDTESLLTQIPINIVFRPTVPAEAPPIATEPEQPVMEEPIEPQPEPVPSIFMPLIDVSRTADLVLGAGLTDNINDATAGVIIAPGEFVALRYINDAGEDLGPAEILALLNITNPCDGECVLADLTPLLYMEQSGARRLGLIFRVAPENQIAATWPRELIPFAVKVLGVDAPVNPVFTEATYRDLTLEFINLLPEGALDVIMNSAQDIVGVMTSKESALALADLMSALVGVGDKPAL